MDKEALYQEHIDVMFGAEPIDDYSEEQINSVLDRLLKCMPNEGKLYKYRSIESEKFDNAFDGLDKGYIYMARANSLNDDLDCTLNFDLEEEVKKQSELLFEKPWLFLETWVNKNLDRLGWNHPEDYWAYQTLMTCVDKETYQLDEEKAVKIITSVGFEEGCVRDFINQCLALVQSIVESVSEQLKEPFGTLANYNEIAKKDIYIFSMSETFDSNVMWGLYANDNKGFCIEYDFNRAKILPFASKRLLISLFKVIYVEEIEKYSFLDMQKYFMTDKQDKDLLVKANKDTLIKMITKTKEWEHEKEWRIFLYNLDEKNKIYADIVSGIIIDERAMKFDNANKLIDLCKQRNWSIKIRKRSKNGTQHKYEEYKI